MAVVAALACLAAMAGCAQPTLQPLPTEAAATSPAVDASTPTPTLGIGAYHGSEPQSSEEAVEVGTLVYEQFLRTSNVVYTHPTDTALIDQIAVGAPAENIKQNAAVMVADDWRVSYADTFAVDETQSQGLPDTADDGRLMPFGTAHVIGCVDLTARVGTWGPQQAPITNVPTPRRVVSVMVEFQSGSGTFVVTEVALLGGEATPC